MYILIQFYEYDSPEQKESNQALLIYDACVDI